MNPNNVDRRHEQCLRETALKRGINDDQLGTLQTLEQFGWLLKFVRETPSGPLAAVHDPDKHRLAVIEPDGQLNENSSICFRPLPAH